MKKTDSPVYMTTVVECAHAKKCKNIARHIVKEMGKTLAAEET